MSARDHRAVVQRFLDELLARHDVDVTEELCAPDITYRSPTGVCQDRDQFKEHFRRIFTALPDIHTHVKYVLAGGDYVVVRACIHATHTGDLPDRPASGRRVSLPVFYGFCIRNGKIEDLELCYDVQTFISEITSVSSATLR